MTDPQIEQLVEGRHANPHDLLGVHGSTVRALRPKDREVIVLFYLEDFSAQRIAELLGISRGAVEVRLHRARAQLKHQLADFMKD